MSRARGKVTERGQVTIPKGMRERLGIRAGEYLEFRETGAGEIVARRAIDRDPVDVAFGLLKPNQTTDELIRDLRGDPDAI